MRIVKDERLMIQGLKHTRMAFVLQNLVILCMVFYRYVIKGVGYGLKLNGSIFRLTSMIDRNTIVFESDEQLKGKNFKLFSLNHSPESGQDSLKELLCCLPKVSLPTGIGYENVFRVLIMKFMDNYDLDIRSVKKSCVHIVHPDGRIIPFDTYNLFYRDEKEEYLKELQGESGIVK